MVNIKLDLEKNRMYLSFAGKYGLDEVKKIGENIFLEIKKLHNGFGVISDLTDFIPVDEEGRQEMLSIMQSLKARGMGNVVRIVRSGVAGYQWQRTSKSAGYSANEVPSLSEADKMLDSLESKL